MTRRWKILVWTLGVLAALVITAPVALVALFFIGLRIWHNSPTFAWMFGAEVLVVYIEEHDRQWPSSWDDLLGGVEHENFGRSWPEDADFVKANVLIEFDLTAEEICGQTVETAGDFLAARPVEPIVWTRHEHWMWRIWDALCECDDE